MLPLLHVSRIKGQMTSLKIVKSHFCKHWNILWSLRVCLEPWATPRSCLLKNHSLFSRQSPSGVGVTMGPLCTSSPLRRICAKPGPKNLRPSFQANWMAKLEKTRTVPSAIKIAQQQTIFSLFCSVALERARWKSGFWFGATWRSWLNNWTVRPFHSGINCHICKAWTASVAK